MKSSIRNALVIIGGTLLVAGCGKNSAPFDAKKYDPKTIAIAKYKGNTVLFNEVSNLCIAELNSSPICGGKASNILFKNEGGIQERFKCSEEFKADETLHACRALYKSNEVLNAIAAQRPKGHYNEQTSRTLWGSKFIEIPE